MSWILAKLLKLAGMVPLSLFLFNHLGDLVKQKVHVERLNVMLQVILLFQGQVLM